MKKLRNTKQRQIILDAVRARCDHPTADEIYLDVRAEDSRISRGTVYRNLSILSETEEILNVKVNAADRYDLRIDPHYHIYCTDCGKTFDAPMEYHSEYDELLNSQTQFRIKRHRLVFEGTCPDCAKKETGNKVPENCGADAPPADDTEDIKPPNTANLNFINNFQEEKQ